MPAMRLSRFRIIQRREEYKMVKLIINGQNIAVEDGTTIMEAAEKVGIHIPHLCYLKDLNEIRSSARHIVIRSRKRNIHINFNFMIESKVGVYVCGCNLSGCNRIDNS